MIFHEMSHFLQLSSEKFIETSKGNSLLQKLPVLAKSMLSRGFSWNEPVFEIFFSEKFMETSRGDSMLEKLPVLAKSMIFHGFSRKEPLIPTSVQKFHGNLETW